MHKVNKNKSIKVLLPPCKIKFFLLFIIFCCRRNPNRTSIDSDKINQINSRKGLIFKSGDVSNHLLRSFQPCGDFSQHTTWNLQTNNKKKDANQPMTSRSLVGKFAIMRQRAI